MLANTPFSSASTSAKRKAQILPPVVSSIIISPRVALFPLTDHSSVGGVEQQQPSHLHVHDAKSSSAKGAHGEANVATHHPKPKHADTVPIHTLSAVAAQNGSGAFVENNVHVVEESNNSNATSAFHTDPAVNAEGTSGLEQAHCGTGGTGGTGFEDIEGDEAVDDVDIDVGESTKKHTTAEQGADVAAVPAVAPAAITLQTADAELGNKAVPSEDNAQSNSPNRTTIRSVILYEPVLCYHF